MKFAQSKSIPASAGVGLKPQHFELILTQQPDIAWFEIHAENYMGAGGPMHQYLNAIRQNYPISIHGVGLSLGSATGLSVAHLNRLQHLVNRYEPGMVSEHLSWSRHGDTVLNDLLPVPYTKESLQVFSQNIDQMQTTLQRQILIENPSSYFELIDGDFTEHEFLVTLAKQSGCKLLLDVNNIYISACNHGFDAKEYVLSIDPTLVGEIHLAGHSVQQTQSGTVRIDDHGSMVCDAVWQLYQFTLAHIGNRPTLIEWDTDVPSWQVLNQQAQLAKQFLEVNE
ncbi:MAG: DUF692 domain-containing protein [Psychrobium sp.]|nr:DUF692 domain-containing protein [Psychrobium sp.]